MRTSRGSILGLWKYQPGVVYETNDLVLGETLSGNYIIGTVINSNYGVSSTAATIDGLISLGVLGPYNAEQFASLAEVVSAMNALLKFYNVTDLNVISGSVFEITVPGLYKVIPESEYLPPDYIGITLSLGYVRVTTNESEIFYELLDFDNNRYFIARRSTHEWVELTGNGITTATSLIHDYYAFFEDANQNLQYLMDEFDRRLRFMEDEYIGWTSNNIILFIEEPVPNGYLVNLAHRERNDQGEVMYIRKYCTRVEASDPYGTTYDEYGTQKILDSGVVILRLGSDVYCTNGYKLV